MTATNHVVTGAVVAAAIGQPAVALPVAFLLHFVLDALPHYGHRDDEPAAKSYERLKLLLPIDAAVAALILLAIVLAHPPNWPVMVLGGILCASPDMMWMPKFVRHLLGKASSAQPNWLMRFHHWIQWGERGWGKYVEAVWFVVIGGLLLNRL